MIQPRHSIGDIIEFTSTKNERTYVDRIDSVSIHCDGTEDYYTQLFPEMPGETGEIVEEQIVRVIEEQYLELPDLPKWPAKKGDIIRYRWDKEDSDKGEEDRYGKVKDAYMTFSNCGKKPEWSRVIITEHDHYIYCDDKNSEFIEKVKY